MVSKYFNMITELTLLNKYLKYLNKQNLDFYLKI